MNYFGFGERYKWWISLFFNEFTVKTQNAGFLSSPFVKTRSINQGCPISPYIFLLSSEIMAHKLVQDARIEGITIGESKLLLSQFADDTTLFLKFDPLVVQVVVEVLQYMEINTGLKVSYEKTTLYRIGSIRNTNARFYSNKKLVWSDEDIELLGVTITNGPIQNSQDYEKSIEKMKSVMNTWILRTLTLMGKVQVINTLMASLFVYKMMVHPNLTKEQLMKIMGIIKIFVWGEKRAKIKMEMLYNPKEYGGLKLVNFVHKQTALKCMWIPKIINDPTWEYVYIFLIPSLKNLIWEANISEGDIRNLIPYSFWREVWCAWARCHYTSQFTDENLEDLLWCNSHIRINNKPLLNNKAIGSGLLYISQIVIEKRCKSFEEIIRDFGPCINWLEYNAICCVILSKCNTGMQKELMVENVLTLDRIVDNSKPTRYIYSFLIERNVENCFNEIANRVGKSITCDSDSLSYAFKCIPKITDVVKLRNFQYRFLQLKIFTNNILFKWRIVDQETCEMCTLNDIQMVKHLYWDCPSAKNLWNYVKENVLNCSLTFESIFLNNVNDKPGHIGNLVTLLTKFYIYQQKCLGKRPSRAGLSQEIKYFQRMEKYNARTQIMLDKYGKRWADITC